MTDQEWREMVVQKLATIEVAVTKDVPDHESRIRFLERKVLILLVSVGGYLFPQLAPKITALFG